MSELVLEHHPDFALELQKVMELGAQLTEATGVCYDSRRWAFTKLLYTLTSKLTSYRIECVFFKVRNNHMRIVCKLYCSKLASSRRIFTNSSLGLLANTRRRQQLMVLLKSFATIKTLVFEYNCDSERIKSAQ